MEKILNTVSSTITTMTEIVLPNDTNTLGNLMGGKLMYWMDICAAIASQRLCGSVVVTASVDNISFSKPIKVGYILTLESRVTRSFNTSMEVFIRVWGENLLTHDKYISNEAFFTFVALGAEGKPKRVPDVLPESDREHEMFNGALRRRQLRLILGGKMKPEDAGELKALFI